MKILITLAILQTVGVGVLIFLLTTSNSQMARTTLTHTSSESRSNWPIATSTLPANEIQLREIIREELAAWNPNANRRNDATTPKVDAVDTRDAEKLRAQRDLVAQRIETYKSVGAITDSQMDELQIAMAELDEPNRKQMMSLLIRAMNAGTIKGHL